MRLELNPARRTEVLHIAGSVIVVIDDTFLDIEGIQRDALEQGYMLPDSGYPGLRARVSPVGARSFATMLAKLVLDQVWPDGHPRSIDLDAIVTETYASVLGLRTRPAEVVDQHVDPGTWLAAVTYLSHTDRPDEGTAFWRHRATGLSCWISGTDPVELLWLQELLGLDFLHQLPTALEALPRPTLQQLRAEIWRQDDEPGCWERLHLAQQKLNRTVVYPSWQIHSAVSRAMTMPPNPEELRLSLGTFITPPFSFTNKPMYERAVYPSAAELGLPE